MNQINYDDFFPEEEDFIDTDDYVLKLSLFMPNDINYNFSTGAGCNEIDIKNSVDKAIENFNSLKVRKKDKGNISNPKIRNKDIIFTLSFASGTKKDIAATIGNTISKFLFHQENWESMVHNSKTKNNHKLFNVEYKSV